MRRYSKKGLQKRKKDREGFAEFYKYHIKQIKENKCSCLECKTSLKGNSSEVVHILPKTYFKSIALSGFNILYLCKDCHTSYDSKSNEWIRTMKIWPTIANRFLILEELILEKINYKHRDRWQA